MLALVMASGYVWRKRGTRANGIAFCAGFIVMLAVRTAVTYHLWGTWLPTPHARVGSWEGVTAALEVIGHRLAGLAVDQEYGLLPYAPVFVLVVFALAPSARLSPGVVATLSVLIVAYLLPVLLPITNVHGWTGGWSPAGRFWVPIVPVLAVEVAVGITLAPRPIVIALVALQIGINAYFWQHPKNLWNDGDGRAAVCERGGATFCDRLPSLVRPIDAVALPNLSVPGEDTSAPR